MYTTIDETGRLNNYAVEPQMYLASFPFPEQQRRYLQQGALAMGFVASLIMVAFLVS